MTAGAAPNTPKHGDGDRDRLYFEMLTRDEQAAAMRRMAAEGMSDSTIASATALSVEFVKQILGPRRPAGI